MMKDERTGVSYFGFFVVKYREIEYNRGQLVRFLLF